MLNAVYILPSNLCYHPIRHHPSPPSLKLSCYRSGARVSPNAFVHSGRRAIPARDRVIDFGKYKGKLLGSLPSDYLKWVSKNLRARDFSDWAKLADEVLDDPIYRDRIEWEFAQKVLSGDVRSSSSAAALSVSGLLEISERFGWDNDDKLGWSKINFGLLGTSRGGRIPRLGGDSGSVNGNDCNKESTAGNLKTKDGEVGADRLRRELRRARLRATRVSAADESLPKEMKAKLEIGETSEGNFGNQNNSGNRVRVGSQNAGSSPFPGRKALFEKISGRRLKKV